MTIEMPAQGKGQGPFVWPDEPEDLKPWDKELQDAIGKERGEMRKRSRIAEMANMDPGDKGVLAKQARALVEGRRAWRPEWKESRDGAALGRGKEEGEQAVVQEEDEEEKRRQERR